MLYKFNEEIISKSRYKEKKKFTAVHTFFIDPNDNQIQFLATHTGKLKPIQERLPCIAQLLHAHPTPDLDIPLEPDINWYIKNWGELRAPKDATRYVRAHHKHIKKMYLDKDQYHYWKIFIETEVIKTHFSDKYYLNKKQLYLNSLYKKRYRKTINSKNYLKIQKKIIKFLQKHLK
jgi:hypothetical protein